MSSRGTGVFLPAYAVVKSGASSNHTTTLDRATDSKPVCVEPKPPSGLASFASPFAAYAGATAATSQVGPSSPCDSNYCSTGSPFMTPALTWSDSLTHLEQQQQTVEQLEELLLLQQQEAEVDAAISGLLTLKQQLTGLAQKPAATAAPLAAAATTFITTPQQQVLPCAAPSLQGVSFATPAFAPSTTAFDMNRASSRPTDLSVFDAAIGEAQLQQHQQQQWAAEQQLEANLQAEMLQLLALV